MAARRVIRKVGESQSQYAARVITETRDPMAGSSKEEPPPVPILVGRRCWNRGARGRVWVSWVPSPSGGSAGRALPSCAVVASEGRRALGKYLDSLHCYRMDSTDLYLGMVGLGNA